MKTLFVVSGGDAPGINALLGQYTRLAAAGGDTVIGAVGGFPGLLAGDLIPLSLDALIPWMGRGGSILPSRWLDPPFQPRPGAEQRRCRSAYPGAHPAASN